VRLRASIALLTSTVIQINKFTPKKYISSSIQHPFPPKALCAATLPARHPGEGCKESHFLSGHDQSAPHHLVGRRAAVPPFIPEPGLHLARAVECRPGGQAYGGRGLGGSNGKEKLEENTPRSYLLLHSPLNDVHHYKGKNMRKAITDDLRLHLFRQRRTYDSILGPPLFTWAALNMKQLLTTSENRADMLLRSKAQGVETNFAFIH
jgi:hypothetical protein